MSQFGVNLTTLKPGAWSAQRHWHRNEDEFIYVLEGEIVLCEDDSETVLKPGDAAGFKANSGNGHCLINRTQKDAVYLEVGTRSVNETVVYSDIDMRLERDKTGVPLSEARPASRIRRGRRDADAEDRPLQNPVRQQPRPIRRNSRTSSPGARSRSSATRSG